MSPTRSCTISATASMSAMVPDEDEIRSEVEAVQAVYGEDCCVLQEFPHHLTVHIRPRTADDSSQQFVEAILGMKLSIEYPRKPPHIYTVETKGLDEKRQTHLITSVGNKANELSSYLMLIALCEEAVEILSDMNHPEGDCPLCLYPLVSQDNDGRTLPFMKLMSCYHCFHSHCIIGWWNWLQVPKDLTTTDETTLPRVVRQRDMNVVNQQKGSCPVCRKVFDMKDIEHVGDISRVNPSAKTFVRMEAEDENLVLESESEINRRQKFEAVFKLQQDRNGIIEPKKDLAILPGMFLPEPIRLPAESVGTSSKISEDSVGAPTRETDLNNSKIRHNNDGAPAKKTGSKNNKIAKAAESKNNTGMRRKGTGHGSRNQPQGQWRNQPQGQPGRKQWIKKELSTSDL